MHRPGRQLHPTRARREAHESCGRTGREQFVADRGGQPQPGARQVLVKMRASGICYSDVHETLGHVPGQFPRILGHEPVAEIAAVAADVTTRKVGDRVGTAWIQSTCGRCEWCQRGRRMFRPY
jgi:D-arabinose 1-dehydrogenase-like Zn-dependent alcohol dehydrogenase